MASCGRLWSARVVSSLSTASARSWKREPADMAHNELTPVAVPAAPGSGHCTCGALRCDPQNTTTHPDIEPTYRAALLVARRCRVSIELAAVIVALAYPAYS